MNALHLFSRCFVFLFVLAGVQASDRTVKRENKLFQVTSNQPEYRLSSLWGIVAAHLNWFFRAGLTERSIEHDGLTRLFLENKPSTLPTTGGALVIFLHGGTESISTIFVNKFRPENRRWVALSDQEGFLFLAPEAWTRDLAGHVWNILRDGEGIRSDVDDVGFITSLVQWAIQERGIDPSRVYCTGSSNGGSMVYRLLIEKSDVFAGGAAFIASLAEESVPQPVSPTPIMIVSASQDQIFPPEGGPVLGDRGSVRSIQATRDYWVNANKADPGLVVKTELPDIDSTYGCIMKLELYPGGSAPVLFYTMTPAGHVYPARESVIGFVQILIGLGLPCRAVEGADLAWEFMSTHG